MQRTLASQTPQKVGEEVLLKGWVNTKRDHGKITFIDLRDRTGIVQVVGTPKLLSELKSECAVEILGLVKARPDKLVNQRLLTGTVEIEAKEVKVLSSAREMPFDMGKEDLDLELPTLLDWRPLTLKHPKQQAIFKVQEAVANGFRKAALEIDCMEVFTPTIAASATEGGAEVFRVDYYDHKAFLIQSPQLYKQIAVGAFERVFLFSHAYRAEPSMTSRHLSEVIQLDCEIAFIKDFAELLDALEHVGVGMIEYAADSCPKILEMYKIEKPLIPTKVPRLKLREAQEIVSKRTGRDLSKELDLNPEDEKEICIWAKEEHNSDFVTITHFPTKKRAFYTMPDSADPEYSLSCDLLFRGIEISSGSQRIHDYDQLIKVMNEKGFDPKSFEIYLQAFKYGMPPEGGFSFGLERVTMKLLELRNVREASLFPRDMERVDMRLSTK
jgi:nondiscriminating aspartyl-tRNA synthetase